MCGCQGGRCRPPSPYPHSCPSPPFLLRFLGCLFHHDRFLHRATVRGGATEKACAGMEDVFASPLSPLPPQLFS